MIKVASYGENTLRASRLYKNDISHNVLEILNDSKYNSIKEMEKHNDNIRNLKFFNMQTLSERMTAHLEVVKRAESTRKNSKVVIGIPCVRRQNDVIYAVRTVSSLLSNLSASHQNKLLIVLFIAEPYNHTFALNLIQLVTTKFMHAVNSALIEFIYPHQELYPDLTNLKSSYGDSKGRIMWRTKEVLDACIVMQYSLPKGEYFLFLEDDVLATPDYFDRIQGFTHMPKKDWYAAKLAKCSKGILFKSEKLWMIIEYLLLFHDDKPIDWLIDEFFKQKTCSISPKDCSKEFILPYQDKKLFHHIGKLSSLSEKNSRVH